MISLSVHTPREHRFQSANQGAYWCDVLGGRKLGPLGCMSLTWSLYRFQTKNFFFLLKNQPKGLLMCCFRGFRGPVNRPQLCTWSSYKFQTIVVMSFFSNLFFQKKSKLISVIFKPSYSLLLISFNLLRG